MIQSRRTWGSSQIPQYAYIEYSPGYRLSHHFCSTNQSEISNTIHSFTQPLLRLCRASESEDRMCDCMNITDYHGFQLLLTLEDLQTWKVIFQQVGLAGSPGRWTDHCTGLEGLPSEPLTWKTGPDWQRMWGGEPSSGSRRTQLPGDLN